MPTDNAPLFFEGPFTVAVTIRRSDGSGSKVLPCVWEIGPVTQEVEGVEDGEETTHRTEGIHATFDTSRVDAYGEGDHIIHSGRVHTILDKLTDGVQTTFPLTKGFS